MMGRGRRAGRRGGRRAARRSVRRQEKRSSAAAPEQAAAQPPPAAQSSAPTGQPDYTAELEKLAQLKTQGILTDEEFSAKKKQILGL